MTPEASFKGKKVTVFGLGLNMGGVGTVRFVAEHGAREIIVTDIKTREELAASVEKLAKYKQITYVLGQHRPEDFSHTDMVIKNPGIPWTNEYIRIAEKAGVPVEMDSSLFFRFCKAPIIGVTGTKGKTTTASLIAHMLQAAGRDTVRAGIGQVGVLSVLEKTSPESIVVFELSSWRLSALGRFKKSPHIAVLTNLYPDHLNYYGTMKVYAEDKQFIFSSQKGDDMLIANFDNGFVRDMVQDAPAHLAWFSETEPVDGDGVWYSEGVLFARVRGKESVLLPIEKVPLKGKHNIGNVLAAAGAALAAGLTVEEVRAGIESFQGVPHRLEHVAEKDGVRYFNDTAATIPEAAIAALRSFDEPVILIAGGSDKRLEFGAFADEILLRSKALILFKGVGTDKLIQALRERLPEGEKEHRFVVVESMGKAVELAARGAEPGDTVLLSPGAASFGIFRNEFDRGEQFAARINELS
jgi:UDP-N-acetylmuramoylalanine--D-glutamate ligase